MCNNLIISLDFLFKIDYYKVRLVVLNNGGAFIMNFKKNFGWIIAVVSVVAAVTAAVTAFLVFRDKKKKDEEELEHYLDCSIQ